MLTSVSASQAPFTNLLISLAFGAGQILIGAAMGIYAARSKRWRQMAFFGLALLGTWAASSGLTELVVSGTELLARMGQGISAATAAQIRAAADTIFLGTSMFLLVLGVGYLLIARFWSARRPRSAGKSH